MDKLIIEVAMNELTSKAQNPRVPYGPAEVAADAAECAAAGASVLHFHAREPGDGRAGMDGPGAVPRGRAPHPRVRRLVRCGLLSYV